MVGTTHFAHHLINLKFYTLYTIIYSNTTLARIGLLGYSRNAEANLKSAKHKTQMAAMPAADLHHQQQQQQGQHQRTTGVASPLGGAGGGCSSMGIPGGVGGSGGGADGVGSIMVMGLVGACDSRRNSPQLYMTDAQADADDPDPDVIPNQYGKFV